MAKRKFNAAFPKLHFHQGRWTLSFDLDEDLIIKTAQELILRRFARKKTPMEDSRVIEEFLRTQLMSEEREVFACLFLNAEHCLIGYEALFYGTVEKAAVYPREVVKAAMRHNCTAVIAAHNHPCGDPDPTLVDVTMNRHLKQALKLVEVSLVDHLIIGSHSMASVEELAQHLNEKGA